jgi:hypothetical protein
LCASLRSILNLHLDMSVTSNIDSIQQKEYQDTCYHGKLNSRHTIPVAPERPKGTVQPAVTGVLRRRDDETAVALVH